MGYTFVANAHVHGVVEVLFCGLRQFVGWLLGFGCRCVFFVFVLLGGGDGQRQDKAEKQSKSEFEKVMESHVLGLPREKVPQQSSRYGLKNNR
jgi:hypothetical protein